MIESLKNYIKKNGRAFRFCKVVYKILSGVFVIIKLPFLIIGKAWRFIQKKFFKFKFKKYLATDKPNDITVVIGVKNRGDYRLVNCLKSLRGQAYPENLIKIIIVDYDSQINYAEKFERLCDRFDAQYLRVENRPVWSRSKSLNIGIKLAKTKFILTSDVDIIFAPNYIQEAIVELKRNPFQYILSKVMDLPKEAVASEIEASTDYYQLRQLSQYRGDREENKQVKGFFGKGINLSYAYIYQWLRGYDERLSVWGGEDNDLIKRFELLGIKMVDLSAKTSYLHQWHPPFEGFIMNEKLTNKINTNKKYVSKRNSLKRNLFHWGAI